MNFIKGKVVSEGAGNLYFSFGTSRILLPGFMKAAASAHVGRELILGVRPEGLCPAHEGKFAWGQTNFVDAKVNVMEPLGDRVDLFLSADSDQVVCRADAHQFGKLVIGGIISIFMDLGRVHLFEPARRIA